VANPEHERQLPLDGYIQPELDMEPQVQKTTRHIMQSVMAESPYHGFPTTLEDGIWDAVHALEDTNGLPEGITADDVYQYYLNVFNKGA
jgi:hypothetical protein